MALFNFGKKKEEEKKISAPICSCDCPTGEAEDIGNDCCYGAENGICCIKVLGAGCKFCHEQYENVKQAVSDMGLSVEVEYITDMQKIMEYGVMSMPALVVNEKVVAMGKVLKENEVVALLQKSELQK
ncbi:MAG: thioredoxin family protein [Eubacteriales bacterium]